MTLNTLILHFSFEKSTQLLQQSLGLKFHHKFPRQIRYECDEDCGGCGMFPNIYHGRSGVQLFADENTWVMYRHSYLLVKRHGYSVKFHC